MFARIILLLAVVAALTSCGSVSKMQTKATGLLTTRTFCRVLVKDFTHTLTDDDGTTPIAAKRFSDHIAAAIVTAKPTARVTRSGKPDSSTLVIGGEVTRYMEGNAALRMLVGMGAGSSYFDANVRLIDGANGQELGMIRVDKNSWGLGGLAAASQNVDGFMQEGANRTAEETVKLLR